MKFKQKQAFPGIFFLTIVLVSAMLLMFHEPWRDELQSWDIARQSHSLAGLFHFSRYEGHPAAWYLVLYAITSFTHDFAPVQWFNWALMAAAIAILLWLAPFTRLQKILAVSGYFFLFEYAVLARNYAIGILAAFTVCFLLKNWRRHWLWLHLALFFMLQCNVFAALLAAAVFAPLWFFGLKHARQDSNFTQKFVSGTLIFLAGFTLSALDMAPPAGTAFMPEWQWDSPQIFPALGAFVHALTPFPNWRPDFWNSHFLSSLTDWEVLPWAEAGLAVVLLALCVWLLRKSGFALAFFLLAWAAITVFLSVKYVGFMRHHGHFYLALVMAFWVKNDLFENKKPEAKQGRGEVVIFTVLLALQVPGSIPAAFFEIKYPFSQSREVADFIEKNERADAFIAGHSDYATSPVAFHLNRPIFYPNAGKSGTFVTWSEERFAHPVDDIVATAKEICRERGSFLLLTSYPVSPEKLPPGIRLLRSFSPAIEKSEEYWLYEVSCD
jgi:hypothetical protein